MSPSSPVDRESRKASPRISSFPTSISHPPSSISPACRSLNSCKARSLAPLLRGESPDDWRQTFYYRYYHSPGHHNTVAHLGVRTKTHKLIYYWDRDAYELFDLVNDPTEQHNLLYSASDSGKPEVQKLFTDLKAEIARLQKEFKDDGQYADPKTWPKGSSDKPAQRDAAGSVDITKAIQFAAGK